MTKSKLLVLDTAPLLKLTTGLLELSESFVTIPEVLAEIKDENAKAALKNSLIKIDLREPTEESLAAIIAFSKKTGDFPYLSVTDLKVLALVYTIEKEQNQLKYYRMEPRCATTNDQKKTQTVRNKFQKSDSPSALASLTNNLNELEISDANSVEKSNQSIKNSSEKLHLVSHKENPVKKTALQLEEQPKDNVTNQQQYEQANVKESNINRDGKFIGKLQQTFDAQPIINVREEEDSDSGEWVTPGNLKQQILSESMKTQGKKAFQARLWDVACITSDFAMQNVMLQMNMRLLSLDGMVIKKIKTFVQRCHACFKATRDMEKKFCPSCGNATLMRTSMGVDANGEVIYYLKKNFQYNLRGTIYSMPKTRGGKHCKDMIYREDQKEYANALKKRGNKTKTSILDPNRVSDIIAKDSMNGPVIGYGRRNPNEKYRNMYKTLISHERHMVLSYVRIKMIKYSALAFLFAAFCYNFVNFREQTGEDSNSESTDKLKVTGIWTTLPAGLTILPAGIWLRMNINEGTREVRLIQGEHSHDVSHDHRIVDILPRLTHETYPFAVKLLMERLFGKASASELIDFHLYRLFTNDLNPPLTVEAMKEIFTPNSKIFDGPLDGIGIEMLLLLMEKPGIGLVRTNAAILLARYLTDNMSLLHTKPLVLYRIATMLQHLFKTEPDWNVQSALLDCIQVIILDSNIHLMNFYTSKMFKSLKLFFLEIPNNADNYHIKDKILRFLIALSEHELDIGMVSKDLTFTAREFDLSLWCTVMQAYFNVSPNFELVTETVKKINKVQVMISPLAQTCILHHGNGLIM